MSPAELKILVIFFYYAVCLGSSLALSSLGTLRTSFDSELLEYLSCEAPGGNICEKTFQRLELELPINFSFVVFSLYPFVNLLYIVKITKIKRMISRHCNCGSVRQSSTQL